MCGASSNDETREGSLNSGERTSTVTDRQNASREGGAQTDGAKEVIYIDATQYKLIVANAPFHPGQLAQLLIDPASVTSSQMMGYGVYEDSRTPIVRLFYENGQTEDVFDVGRIWSK